MRIKIKTQSGVTVWLHAETFAQSAAENNIDVISFKASMDKFSNESESSIEDIQKWRDEANCPCLRYVFAQRNCPKKLGASCPPKAFVKYNRKSRINPYFDYTTNLLFFQLFSTISL